MCMIVIKGGTVVTSQGKYEADVKVEDGKITEIGLNLTSKGEVIDATGCYVFPGFIDPHTHFELDTGSAVSPDDFRSGTRAAVIGGTTTIIDFATAFRGETLKEGLDNWHKMADGVSSCNYGFHMAFTEWNQDLCAEIPKMAEEGITSFKVYMAYDNLKTTNDEISEILTEVKKVGGVVGCHCEIGDMVTKGIGAQKALGNFLPSAHPLSRPDVVEAEAVKEYLSIAKEAGAVVNVVHLSTKAGLEEIRKARKEGQKVFVETCPHYLLLDDSHYSLPDFEGAKFTMSPPLRKQADMDSLWEAVADGEINTIATDHCSFDMNGQKTLGAEDFSKIPSGIPGVENRVELIYTYGVCTGRITLEQMTAMLSENVAKEYGMFPQRGIIQVGSDADIVIWDPNDSHIITQKNQHYGNDYTPFEGIEIKGRTKDVILNGQHVVKNKELVKECCGQYITRGPVIDK